MVFKECSRCVRKHFLFFNSKGRKMQLFFEKKNDIYSFKLIKYIDIIQIQNH